MAENKIQFAEKSKWLSFRCTVHSLLTTKNSFFSPVPLDIAALEFSDSRTIFRIKCHPNAICMKSERTWICAIRDIHYTHARNGILTETEYQLLHRITSDAQKKCMYKNFKLSHLVLTSEYTIEWRFMASDFVAGSIIISHLKPWSGFVLRNKNRLEKYSAPEQVNLVFGIFSFYRAS